MEHRTFSIQLGETRGEERAVEASLSSEYPVQRASGKEVLVHSEQAIDLSRAPLPLLRSHEQTDLPVGIVENLKVVGDKLRGLLRFGNSSLAKEIWEDVKSGILRSLSIGYLPLKEERGNGDSYKVTRWQPLEVSLVSVPADSTVGIGRSEGGMDKNDVLKLRKKTLGELIALTKTMGETPLEDVTQEMSRSWNDNLKALEDKLEAIKVLPTRTDDRGLFGEDRDEDAPTLVFEDNHGNTHRAISPKERFPLDGDHVDGDGGIRAGSMGRILRARLLGDPTELNDAERRAMGEGTGSLGGWWVPEELSAQVIDLARNKTVCMQAGGYTLPMSGPELTLVKILTDPTGYWVKESEEITESEGSIGPITLKAIKLGVLVRVSMELLEDAPNAGQAIENQIASAMALELDRVGLFGDGVNEPRGLWECTSVNSRSMGTNGAAPTNYDKFSYAVQDIAAENGEANAVIMAPRTFYTIDRLKEGTTNAPLRGPASWEKLTKHVTNQVPITQTQGTCSTASCAFVGDFRQMVFGMRKNIAIEATREGGTGTFAKYQALIRGVLRVDVAVLREPWFTLIKGIKET